LISRSHLQQLLRSLRLLKMFEIYPEVRQQAERDDIGWDDFLLRLARPEYHARQEQAMKSRIKRAGLPELWSLESFPFARQPGVSRKQIRAFAELDFIPQATNLVFYGKTGVGKTGLATGLLLKAMENGYRGAFVRAQDLFDEMYASLADRSTRKLVSHLARLDLLVIDSCAAPSYVESALEGRAVSESRGSWTSHNYGRRATLTSSQRLEPVKDGGV
jgi:DNA replication protein DnaC